jgi:hypothetical protein
MLRVTDVVPNIMPSTKLSAVTVLFTLNVYDYISNIRVSLSASAEEFTQKLLSQSGVTVHGVKSRLTFFKRHVRTYTVNRSGMAFKKRGKESFNESTLRIHVEVTVCYASMSGNGVKFAAASLCDCCRLGGAEVVSIVVANKDNLNIAI